MLTEEYPTVVTEDAGFVRLAVSGPYSRSRFERLLQRVGTETGARRMPRALIDGRAATLNLSTIARYEIGVQIADTIGSKIRLAFVLMPSAVDGFAETVARNRGANVGVFTDEPVAREWLGRPGPPGPGA